MGKPDNAHTVEIEGYEPFHRPRKNDNINIKEGGGGISVFIKNGIDYRIRYELNVTLPYAESLFVEVKYNNKNYMIGIIYHIESVIN